MVGDTDTTDSAARQVVWNPAAMIPVVRTMPYLDTNGDIDLGYLVNPSDRNESISYADPSLYNTIQVRIQYSSDNNTPISLFFAPFIGISSADLAVTAAATFSGTNTVGFRVTDKTGNATLLPYTVKVEDWDDLLGGAGEDNWAYDPETGTVSPGPDGIREMRMFPEKGNNNNGNGQGGGGITPGNFGTVDIGNPIHAAPDLWRQIREGPSPEDFSYYDNSELKLDPLTGTVSLNGDTGMTVSMQAALADIVGQPRTIFLYSGFSGQGNQTWFTIVRFVGVRVVDFALTGNDKYVLIQPSAVADPSAISGDNGSSNFVGPPVHLVR